ncbi:cytochrome b5 [Xylariaceae sp. FL0016]|nr:cytochrome b5 [Xylariaceae sp. FL0016]
MATETRGSVRQRKAKAGDDNNNKPKPVVEEVDTDEAEEIERSNAAPLPKPSPAQRLEDEDEDYSPWLDILRVLSFLLAASCGLSYLISGGESFTWGVRQYPKYMQVDWWKTQLKGPLYLTPSELALYDGTDETKPIYVAINGTVYDVSANRRTYGPGGSYRFLAGADAARAYVTGCFAQDRTPDLRGVEAMFLPLDDPRVDAHWSAADLEALRAREMREALDKVHEGVLHWMKFFRNNPKYPLVGYVKKDKDWLEKEPLKPLCETAAKGRKPRKIPEAQ